MGGGGVQPLVSCKRAALIIFLILNPNKETVSKSFDLTFVQGHPAIEDLSFVKEGN